MPHRGAPRLSPGRPLARIAWLARWAQLAARDAVTVAYARELASGTDVGRPLERAAEVLARAQRRVRFLPDPGERAGVELYRTARETIAAGEGDCDDAAPLLVAVFRALGYRARLVAMRSPRQAAQGPYPRHVSAQVSVDGGRSWWWAEPTVRGARLGEHPYAAAARLRERRADLGA